MDQEVLEGGAARGASAAEATLVEGDTLQVQVRLGEVDVVKSASLLSADAHA